MSETITSTQLGNLIGVIRVCGPSLTQDEHLAIVLILDKVLERMLKEVEDEADDERD